MEGILESPSMRFILQNKGPGRSNMKELTLQSGATVPLTLNFLAQYKLRETSPEEYNRYKRAFDNMNNKDEDRVFLMLDILYTAYLCGQIIQGDEQLEDAMGYQEFLYEVPEDTTEVMLLATELISKKKLADFVNRSSVPQEG